MNLPILDGKNFDHWRIQMKAIFGFQDCLDVVQQRVQELNENSSEAEKVEFRDAKKRDCKAIFLIHQCMDHANFEKIFAATSSKEAWEILDKCYSRGVKVKKVRLQMMRRQYELLQMEDQESIADYFTRIRTLINVMKGCGSLEAYEQRFLERMLDRQSQQALSAQFKKKNNFEHFDRFNKDNGKWNSGRKTDEEKPYHTGRGFPTNNSTNLSHDVESGNARKGNHKFNGKKNKDKSKIQCFNCKKWGHFASECKCKLKMKSKDAEASLAKEEDSDEEVLLMAKGEVTDLEISTLDEKLLMFTTKGDQ
ncbi:PREDICTED: uncharacterized protein LOC109342311 [Lupinus angustifolius]|uniref:uncharacterized protein LOC109342311 n=1 Tax=Lupinus angustifolius TaxID=3871 RepID=UPI00092E2120|nr:PREDICTED: uncharacterized protein LOC109342311 [Lupinus angustifolius]